MMRSQVVFSASICGTIPTATNPCGMLASHSGHFAAADGDGAIAGFVAGVQINATTATANARTETAAVNLDVAAGAAAIEAKTTADPCAAVCDDRAVPFVYSGTFF